MEDSKAYIAATLHVFAPIIRNAVEEYVRKNLLPMGMGIREVELLNSEACIHMVLLPPPEVAPAPEDKTSGLWFKLDDARRDAIEILKAIPWPNQMAEHPKEVEWALNHWTEFIQTFILTLAALAKAGRLESSDSIPQELIDWMSERNNPPDVPRLIYYENHRGDKAWRGVVITRVWHGSSKFYPEVGWYFDAFDIQKWAMRTFQEQRVIASGLAYPGCHNTDFGFEDRYRQMKRREERRMKPKPEAETV